jgi:hypothetical protein
VANEDFFGRFEGVKIMLANRSCLAYSSEMEDTNMKARIKQITVRACRNVDSYERGWDVEQEHMLTMAEAKQKAKYYLTDAFMNACEASERLGYSQVLVNGEVMYDYFSN